MPSPSLRVEFLSIFDAAAAAAVAASSLAAALPLGTLAPCARGCWCLFLLCPGLLSELPLRTPPVLSTCVLCCACPPPFAAAPLPLNRAREPDGFRLGMTMASFFVTGRKVLGSRSGPGRVSEGGAWGAETGGGGRIGGGEGGTDCGCGCGCDEDGHPAS